MEAPFKEFQMPYFFKSFHVLFSENSYFVSHQAVNFKRLRTCCCKLPFRQLVYLAMFVPLSPCIGQVAPTPRGLSLPGYYQMLLILLYI